MSVPPPAGDSKGIEDMDMNTVRLCFQCELEWDDGRKDNLSPVVSNPIYDKSEMSPRALAGTPPPAVESLPTPKTIHPTRFFFLFVPSSLTEATTTSQLKITCLNLYKGTCAGQTEIYMLCDKVQKGAFFMFGFEAELSAVLLSHVAALKWKK